MSDAALSEHGGSFTNISHPASLQSFDFIAASAPGSPASYQAAHGEDGEERGVWLAPQVPPPALHAGGTPVSLHGGALL